MPVSRHIPLLIALPLVALSVVCAAHSGVKHHQHKHHAAGRQVSIFGVSGVPNLLIDGLRMPDMQPPLLTIRTNAKLAPPSAPTAAAPLTGTRQDAEKSARALLADVADGRVTLTVDAREGAQLRTLAREGQVAWPPPPVVRAVGAAVRKSATPPDTLFDEETDPPIAGVPAFGSFLETARTETSTVRPGLSARSARRLARNIGTKSPLSGELKMPIRMDAGATSNHLPNRADTGATSNHLPNIIDLHHAVMTKAGYSGATSKHSPNRMYAGATSNHRPNRMYAYATSNHLPNIIDLHHAPMMKAGYKGATSIHSPNILGPGSTSKHLPSMNDPAGVAVAPKPSPPSPRLFKALSVLAAHSDRRHPLGILTLLRPPYSCPEHPHGGPRNPHSLGLAADIGSFAGHQIATADPESSVEAIVAILRVLPPGRYRLGLPKAPENDLPAFATEMQAAVPGNEIASSAGGDRVAWPSFTPKPWPFFPTPLLDRSPVITSKSTGARGTNPAPAIVRFKNECYAPESALGDNRLKAALLQARERGADVWAIFPDGADHLHLDVQPN